MMSASTAGNRVEKATSEFLTSPDWTLNMEICDVVNANQWLAKDVIKAVKKRLQHKNPRIQFYALILLETLIKNCGDHVHHQVAERDILHDMVKIVKKKTDMQVRDKVLLLLESWQEAFGGPHGKYPQYYGAYIELKSFGIKFPECSSNAAPIFTPPITHPVSRPPVEYGASRPPVEYGVPSHPSVRLDEAMASEMQIRSLSDLESIRRPMEVLNDMLQAINPTDREAVKDELIIDLLKQCQSNQKKLMDLVNTTSDEELLAQSLTLNDNLQYLISKHDAIASGSPLPTNTSEMNQKASEFSEPAATAEAGATKTVATAASTISHGTEEEEDDDEFSQLARRKSKSKSEPSEGLSAQDGDQKTSPTMNSVTAKEDEEEASTSASNALTISSAPVTTDLKEQDMIDFLSLTLSTNPPASSVPPTESPVVSTTSSYGTRPHVPATYGSESQVPAATTESNLHNPQPVPVTPGGYNPYNSYVAPWARQTMPQPISEQHYPQNAYSSSYPPPPWANQPGSISSYPPPAGQHPPSMADPSNGHTPTRTGRQLQQQNSLPSGPSSSLASRTLQQRNSFGSSSGVMESRPMTNPSVAPGNKPFIPSYRLFEDLIDLRSDNKTKTSGVSSTTGSRGQSMIGDRK